MRHAVAAVLISLTAACASHAGQSISYYEAGDYRAAARAADEGLVQHPHDDGLWAMRVRAALALGDADGVAKAYAGYVAERGSDDHDLLRDVSSATLAQALDAPSSRLAQRAIEAIEQIEIQALADKVADKLGSDDDRVAATAAIAILRGGYPQAAQVADAMLHGEDPEARRIVVDGLGRKMGKLALDDLEQAGSDPDPRVRAAALRWLGQLRDANAVTLCTKRMSDGDAAVRATAAEALAHIGSGDLTSAAAKALDDHALEVRLAGVQLLAAAHADAQLVQLAGDPDPMVALQAAIAAHRADLAGAALQRAITAKAWTTRAGAANLLVEAVGRAAALPIAHQLAGDGALEVRLAAARVLAHDGDPAAAAAVLAAALHNPEQGIQAAADLAELGDPRGLAALDDFVRDPRLAPEQRAAAAAAHLTAHHVTPGLVAALADPSGLVRVEAAAAIGMLAKD